MAKKGQSISIGSDQRLTWPAIGLTELSPRLRSGSAELKGRIDQTKLGLRLRLGTVVQ